LTWSNSPLDEIYQDEDADNQSAPRPNSWDGVVVTLPGFRYVSTRPRLATFPGGRALHFARSWRFFHAGATHRNSALSNRHEMRLLTIRRISPLV
jgi:hypothetical protein